MFDRADDIVGKTPNISDETAITLQTGAFPNRNRVMNNVQIKKKKNEKKIQSST